MNFRGAGTLIFYALDRARPTVDPLDISLYAKPS